MFNDHHVDKVTHNLVKKMCWPAFPIVTGTSILPPPYRGDADMQK